MRLRNADDVCLLWRPTLSLRGPSGGVELVYLQGIDIAEIIETVHARRAPMLPVTTALRS